MSELLKGLEISIISTSALSKENPKSRLDAQFQNRAALAAIRRILAIPHHRITDLANHALKGKSVAYSHDGNFPVIRSGNISNNFQPETLLRSSCRDDAFFVKKNDILISSIGQGSIGKIQLFRNDGEFATVPEVTVVRAFGMAPACLSAFLASNDGQVQIERYTTGATGQLHLYPRDVDRIVVPDFSTTFQSHITRIHDQYTVLQQDSLASYAKAERTILEHLQLQQRDSSRTPNFLPSHRQHFTTTSSNVMRAQRLDAQFFTSHLRHVFDASAETWATLGDVVAPRHERFNPKTSSVLDYIEIGDVNTIGGATSTHMLADEAPSRAQWLVRAGDVITSTVRPIRRLSALMIPEQDGAVCSSGFIVLTPQGISSELLLTWLRLPVVCGWLDLHSRSSMYPSITESDILNLPIPLFSNTQTRAIQHSIGSAVAAAFEKERRANTLLGATKRAVEIAIEDGESAALQWLDTFLEH